MSNVKKSRGWYAEEKDTRKEVPTVKLYEKGLREYTHKDIDKGMDAYFKKLKRKRTS